MIGIIRFHSSPRPIEFPGRDGLAVEFGYRVFLTYRSNGYATEAVKAMMDWSQLHYGINKYLASVSPDNLISNRLISSFGFIKVGEVNDETDGIEYVFLKET
jgi:ribosomal-protein-alanine N-acetyltransferase